MNLSKEEVDDASETFEDFETDDEKNDDDLEDKRERFPIDVQQRLRNAKTDERCPDDLLFMLLSSIILRRIQVCEIARIQFV